LRLDGTAALSLRRAHASVVTPVSRPRRHRGGTGGRGPAPHRPRLSNGEPRGRADPVRPRRAPARGARRQPARGVALRGPRTARRARPRGRAPAGSVLHALARQGSLVSVRIGTSGYNYREWKGTFYPADLPAAKMLPYYAAR